LVGLGPKFPDKLPFRSK